MIVNSSGYMASISLVSGFIYEPGWFGGLQERIENIEIPANMPTDDIPADIDSTDSDRQLVQSETLEATESQPEIEAQLLSLMSKK